MATFNQRRGRVEMTIKTEARRPRKQFPDDFERGRVRKAIEDRKIQKELLEGDLW